jgi:chromosome segregation ATPase
VRALESEIASIVSQKNILQTSLTDANAKLKDLGANQQRLQSELSVLQNRSQSHEQTCQVLRSDLEKEKAQAERLSEEISRKDRQVSKIQADLEASALKNHECVADMTLLKNDLDLVEGKYQELEGEIGKANEIIAKLQSDSRMYKGKYRRATIDVEHFSQENTSLKESNAILTKDSASSHEKIVVLEKELLEERNAKKSLENELKSAQNTIERHIQSTLIRVSSFHHNWPIFCSYRLFASSEGSFVQDKHAVCPKTACPF